MLVHSRRIPGLTILLGYEASLDSYGWGTTPRTFRAIQSYKINLVVNGYYYGKHKKSKKKNRDEGLTG